VNSLHLRVPMTTCVMLFDRQECKEVNLMGASVDVTAHVPRVGCKD